MTILKFPGPGPFKVPPSYLAKNQALFARHGYDLSVIRSEAELALILELISAAELSSVADRLAAAASEPGNEALFRDLV
jgi:hypothetical protein